MNTTCDFQSTRSKLRPRVLLVIRSRLPLLGPIMSGAVICLILTGCFGFLKPAQSTARYYVLTPIAGSEQGATRPAALAVGIGQVRLPVYLLTTSLAIRKGVNEVEYVPSALWAERLDSGFQRVLAADLGALLPTDRVYVSAWNRDDVTAELYVTVEQFDVDAAGLGVLAARWRIVSPGGDALLRTGRSRLTQQGPSPEAGPQGAVETLSGLVADFSRQMTLALQEVTEDHSNRASSDLSGAALSKHSKSD